MPLTKPLTGHYHLIRFIRSDRGLDIFGEKFRRPPKATYEYVRAAVEVAAQSLQVYLDNRLVDQHDYRLR